MLLANKHRAFAGLKLADLQAKMTPPVLIDIKNRFDRAEAAAAGFYYRTL